jgi:hypothetical protein
MKSSPFNSIDSAELYLTGLPKVHSKYNQIIITPLRLINNYRELAVQARITNQSSHFYEILKEYEELVLKIACQTLKQNHNRASKPEDQVTELPKAQQEQLKLDFAQKYRQVNTMLNTNLQSKTSTSNSQSDVTNNDETFGDILKDMFKAKSFNDFMNKL